MLQRLLHGLRERERAGGRGQYKPISDYGLIGDQSTVALVARDGSIDWACLPRFDSPPAFCRILDHQRGGTFRVGPVNTSTVHREYLESSAVLSTAHQTLGGRMRVIDFFSVAGGGPGSIEWKMRGGSRILRCVEGIAGEVEVEIRFHPTLGFARRSTDLIRSRGGVVGTSRNQWVSLACPVPLLPDDRGGMRAVFRLKAGERVWLKLCYGSGPAPVQLEAPAVVMEDELQKTLAHWRDLTRDFHWDGPYEPMVRRSALVMRLLTYRPTGAMVAAPTLSLPEELATPRNFDYRFAWIRDSSLAARALTAVGFHHEAQQMLRWLLDALSDHGSPERVTALAVRGERPPRSRKVRGLEGYRGSGPIRMGFRTVGENDDYGELLEAVAVWPEVVARKHWRVLRKYANAAAMMWRVPDRSIWEIPGRPQRYVYSALMCWASLDRAIRIAYHTGKRIPFRALARTRDRIRHEILTRGYNHELGTFTQALDGSALDASALVLPLSGFLPATDPRMRSTIRVIRERLAVGPLVYRYLTSDRLPGVENGFVLCSFWLVDNLLMLGEVDRAREIFEGVTAHTSDLGFLSEEISIASGELRGNYPQLLSHLGLIRSAHLFSMLERKGVDRFRRDSPYALLLRAGDTGRTEPGLA